MRVLTKLRGHNISMVIEVTTLSPTLTCQFITHQYSRTMRIFHMEEEHNKVKDLGRIFNVGMFLPLNLRGLRVQNYYNS